MIFHIQSLKEKYLRGWERQATVILLASALLLTLHRYYSRRSFFKRHFAEYFGNAPSGRKLPILLLVSDYSIYLATRACPRREIRNNRATKLSDYGCPTRKPETRLACDR